MVFLAVSGPGLSWVSLVLTKPLGWSRKAPLPIWPPHWTLWCIYILMGSLPLLCYVVPQRTNSTLCCPWQVSLPLASKWWLKILLHLLEEGMWSLGGSCAAPRQSPMVQGDPCADLPDIISFLPSTLFVLHCPPAWAFLPFPWATVLNE